MSAAALERLKARFGDAILVTHSLRGDDTAIIDSARVLEICRFLRDDRPGQMIVNCRIISLLPQLVGNVIDPERKHVDQTAEHVNVETGTRLRASSRMTCAS